MNYQPPRSPIYQEAINTNDDSSTSLTFRTDREKIHRIRCLVPYLAHVVDVVSPSEIWIQHPNHITSKLTQSPKKCVLISSEKLKDLMYAMAPVDPFTLGRARILKVYIDEGNILVRFIDHGFVALFKTDKIYEMPAILRTHPWQTVPVVLFGLQPLENECWSKKEIKNLKSILKRFDMFWVIPHFTQKKIDDDSIYQRVSMNGLSDEEVELILKSQKSEFMFGESILEAYFSEFSLPIFSPVPVVDALEQNVYSRYKSSRSLKYHVDELDNE